MWSDVAIIAATLLGPILAVQAQKLLERRRSATDRRLMIFRTLMATRASVLSPEHVQALNAIPVEFYGNSGRLKEINDAWKLFLDHHGNDPTSGDVWLQRRVDLFMDLLFQISKYLGYNFNRSQLERDIYNPKAHGDLESEQTIIRKGLAQLFRGEGALPMAVKEFPAIENDDALGSQKLQQLLLELLQGSRTMKVEIKDTADRVG